MKKFYFFIVALFAMLAASAENPTLYLLGDVNSWSASDAYQFTEDNGVYTLEVAELTGAFKIADSSWSASSNFGSVKNIAVGTTYTLEVGSNTDNCTLSAYGVKDAKLTFTLDSKELVIEGTEFAEVITSYPDLWLRGEINSWGDVSDEYKFEGVDGVYTLSLESLSGQFKISDDSWGTNFGGATSIELGQSYTLEASGSNCALKAGTANNVTITFNYASKELVVEGELPTENPTLYLRGEISSWEATDEYKFEEVDGVYTLSVSELSGEFKIAQSDWSATNYGGITGIVAGQTYTLTEGGDNCTLNASSISNAVITFNIETKELVIEGEEAAEEEPAEESFAELYLRGDVNGWEATDDYKFTTTDGKIYTLELATLEPTTYGFQIATSDWATRYNVENYQLGYGVYEASSNAEYNMNVTETLESPVLTLNVEDRTLEIAFNSVVTQCGYDYSAYEWVATNEFNAPIVPVEGGVQINNYLQSGLTIDVTLSTDGSGSTSIDGQGWVCGDAEMILGDESFWYVYQYGTTGFSETYNDFWTYFCYYDSNNSPYGYYTLYYTLPTNFGEKYLSNTTTIVDNIAVEAESPVEYFNLQGVRVANPENGLYIRRQGGKAAKVLVK